MGRIKIKPKLRKKVKTKRPLGALIVLGALLLAALVAQYKGPQRSPLVWEDFDRQQGVFLGAYYKRGKKKIAIQTPEGLLVLGVDKSVDFRRVPPIGMLCEVAYTKGDTPTIVRSQDLRTLDVTDGKGGTWYPRRTVSTLDP